MNLKHESSSKVQPAPPRYALLSAWHKKGLESVAQSLVSWGYQLIATDSTMAYLQGHGIPVVSVQSITAMPAFLGGRVKTLHPAILGGILGRRGNLEDCQDLEKWHAPWIDVVVVDLYPFHEADDKPLAEAVEKMDIGGVTLLRAAAKNFRDTCPIADAHSYGALQEELNAHQGSLSLPFRQGMAASTMACIAQYDLRIALRFARDLEDSGQAVESRIPLLSLAYGENPHQKAGFLKMSQALPLQLRQGKPLSYNNLLDASAAFQLVSEFSEPALAIVKHNTPCGVAVTEEKKTDGIALLEAARQQDPLSPFGGVLALNVTLESPLAQKLIESFWEVILCPSITADAARVLAQKPKMRVIECGFSQGSPSVQRAYDVRTIAWGYLLQERDQQLCLPQKYRCVTDIQAPMHAYRDMHLAWAVAKHVRSNAIVLTSQGRTVGIGGGFTNRVGALKAALAQRGESVSEFVVASDGFFPFDDSIELLEGLPVAAVIQPGGSLRDKEVIAACHKLKIPMYFTDERHFRH